jgi:hypothetical protein
MSLLELHAPTYKHSLKHRLNLDISITKDIGTDSNLWMTRLQINLIARYLYISSIFIMMRFFTLGQKSTVD